MPEYDRERFELLPDPELVCPICHCVLDNPQETLCRHVFCKVCIDTWMKSQTGGAAVATRCPTCRKYLHISEIKSALPLLCNLISKLRVKCIHCSNGCTVILAKELIAEHEKLCGFESHKCRHQGCGKSYLKKDKEKHDTECEMKLEMCTKECELMVTRRDMKGHICIDELKKRLLEKDSELRQSQEMINDILSGHVRSMASAVRRNTVLRPNIAAEVFANVRNHIHSYARTIAHDPESTARFATSLMSSLQTEQETIPQDSDSYQTPTQEYSPASSYSPGYNPTPEYIPFSPHNSPNDALRAEYRPTPIPRYSPFSPPRRFLSLLWDFHYGEPNRREVHFAPNFPDGYIPPVDEDVNQRVSEEEEEGEEEEEEGGDERESDGSYSEEGSFSSQSSHSSPRSSPRSDRNEGSDLSDIEDDNSDHDQSDVDRNASDVGHDQSDEDHDQSDIDHDQSDVDHDQSDENHDQSDADRDVSDVDHGQSDADNDRSDEEHVQSDVDHDQSDTDHDQSDEDHNQSDVDQDQSDVDHDQSDVDHDQSDDQSEVDLSPLDYPGEQGNVHQSNDHQSNDHQSNSDRDISDEDNSDSGDDSRGSVSDVSDDSQASHSETDDDEDDDHHHDNGWANQIQLPDGPYHSAPGHISEASVHSVSDESEACDSPGGSDSSRTPLEEFSDRPSHLSEPSSPEDGKAMGNANLFVSDSSVDEPASPEPGIDPDEPEPFYDPTHPYPEPGPGSDDEAGIDLFEPANPYLEPATGLDELGIDLVEPNSPYPDLDTDLVNLVEPEPEFEARRLRDHGAKWARTHSPASSTNSSYRSRDESEGSERGEDESGHSETDESEDSDAPSEPHQPNHYDNDHRSETEQHDGDAASDVDQDKMSEGSFEPDYTEPESDVEITIHERDESSENDSGRRQETHSHVTPSSSPNSDTSCASSALSLRKRRRRRRENGGYSSAGSSDRGRRSPQAPGSSHWSLGSSSDSDSSHGSSYSYGRKRKHASSKRNYSSKRRRKC